MLGAYRAVFRVPGTAAFAAAAFVMRFPIALYPIGLVLILSARTGHYGFAGVLSGVYVLANGAGNPLLARLTDRYGQRKLLVPASIAHVAATLALAAFVIARSSDWTLLAPAAVSGFTFLSVGSMVRARWSYVLAGRRELPTAYSLESTLDEVIFVVGPLAATLIATQLVPVLVLFVGAAIVLGGAIWLASLRDSEPPPRPVDAEPHPSAIRERGMPLLTLVAVAMGTIFASAEVTMVAFCGQHGHKSLSGLTLAMFAFGSATAGFLYGSRTWRADLLTRFRLQASVFAVLPVLFLTAPDIATLAVVAFVAGLGIAPTLITSFGLVERLVPGGSLTEGLAWIITGLSVGYGAGAALVGGIADAHGARAAFGVTVSAALAMGALSWLLHAQLRGSRPTRSRPSMAPSEHAALP